MLIVASRHPVSKEAAVHHYPSFRVIYFGAMSLFGLWVRRRVSRLLPDRPPINLV